MPRFVMQGKNGKIYIPVSSPVLKGNEKKYVFECLDSNWISSHGKYIEEFENKFASFCGVEHGMSCCNGTAALHLALLAVGVGPGDEVIIPTLTYIATANAVVYCGAKPVFVDSESLTWNMDPELIEDKITPRTKAIIVVHLYGHPVDMDPVKKIAQNYNLYIIEDAAEAHGAEYKGIRTGNLGDIAIFSFFGNKIITTGEGGMVVTNDSELSKKVRCLKGQGVDPDRRYWFPLIGYNYRMTNIQAAIGLAQFEYIDWHIERHLEIARNYKRILSQMNEFSVQPEAVWGKNVYWMVSILIDESLKISRDQFIEKLLDFGIETRPVFYPMHILPPYKKKGFDEYPISEKIARRGLNLPTWAGLSDDNIEYICEALQKIACQNIHN